MFRRIKGQDHTVELLRRAIQNDRVAQAYLFHGSDGVGKFMTALYFGMALNCVALPELRPCGQCDSCHKFLALEHPDLIYVFPTPILDLSVDGLIKKKEALTQYQAYLKNKINRPWEEFFFKENTGIRLENIYWLMKRLELSIHEARYRIVIIENIDEMTIQTANAFLKTLEEPPRSTVIIMITERLQMVLPTILSRTQPVYFKPLARSVIETILAEQFAAEPSVARIAARISAGNLKTAIRMVQDSAPEPQQAALELVELAANSNDQGYLAMLNRRKEYQTKEQINELLKFLRILAGDLAAISLSEALEITNIDKLELLKHITANCPGITEGSHDYLLSLEDFNRKLEGNVNPQLIMINLYLRTRNWLHSKL